MYCEIYFEKRVKIFIGVIICQKSNSYVLIYLEYSRKELTRKEF